MKYNVIDYGAEVDGALCTEAIQNAIDACFLAGGGEVIIPAGRFITGGLRLRSNVTLHLLSGARLVGSTNPEDYVGYINDKIEPISEEERESIAPTVMEGNTARSAMPFSRWNNAIIRVINANNVAIIGDEGSEINGRNCFDEVGEEKYRGPHAINMWYSKNIRLEGYTIVDSANWAHAIHNSANITLRGVTVLGGHDGFDVRTCDNVEIEGCTFKTGDDCIAGFDNINVTVRNCYFESSCSLLRFGGYNILVEDCIGVAPSSYGFRGSLTDEKKRAMAATDETCKHTCTYVFNYYCDNRAKVRVTPGNILFRNCRFTRPEAIIGQPFGVLWCTNRSLNDLTFVNCRFEDVGDASLLWCPENEPLTLNMTDCAITARAGSEDKALFDGRFVKEINLTNVSIEGFENPHATMEPAAIINVANGPDVAMMTRKDR